MATTSPETATKAAQINRAELKEKTRVHALAKMLGMTSAEMVRVLADNGFEDKRPASTLPKADVEKVLDALAPQQLKATKATKKTTKKAAKKSAKKTAKKAEKKTAKKATKKSAKKAAEKTPEDSAKQAPAAPADAASEQAGVKEQASAPERASTKEQAAVEGQSQATHDLPVFQAPEEPAATGVEQKDVDEKKENNEAQEPRAPRRRVRRVVRRLGAAEGAGAVAEKDGAEKETPESEHSEEAEEKKPARRRSRRSRGRGKSAQNTAQHPQTGKSEDKRGAEDSADTAEQAEIKPEQLHPAERDDADIVDEPVRLKGSTRLESRRKWRAENRRESRHIVSRGEFLARRESVERKMVVRDSERTDHPGLTTQVGVVEDGMLVEHFVTSETQQSTVGNVYLGTVQNVLGSMEAAFIDIGTGRNAVLYAGEMNWHSPHLHSKGRRIDQALKAGDQIMVQVIKDPVGHKGARLTGRISFAGRYLVYFPGGTTAGISRKLPEGERKRLKDILGRVIPGEGGAIIRTAAENVEEDQIGADVERLHRIWEGVEKEEAKARNRKGAKPITLYEEPNMLVKVVRDIFNEDFSELIVDGDKSWSMVRDYVSRMAPDLKDRVVKWHAEQNAGQDVFAALELDEQLQKALSRKVWLPSGGHLVIDHTEAMTVIDVNTGSFIGAGGNLEETVTQNNLEAAEEIVRQMRLRDLGGMIVVDFIDMVLEENQDLVLRRLTEYLGRDRTRHKVSEVTSLGLVQMTRKRLGTGLLDTFSTVCEHCGGRGVIVHADPVEHSEEEQERPRRDHGHRKERQQARREQRRREEAQAKRASAEVAKKVHAASAKEDAAEDAVEENASEQQAQSASSRSDGRRRSRRVRRQSGQRAGQNREQDQEHHDTQHSEDRGSRQGTAKSAAEQDATKHGVKEERSAAQTGSAQDSGVRRTRRVRRVVRRHHTAASETTADRAAVRRAESKRRDTGRRHEDQHDAVVRNEAGRDEVRRDSQRDGQTLRARRPRRVVRKRTSAPEPAAGQQVEQSPARKKPAAKVEQKAQTYEEAKREFERSPRRKRNTRGNSRSDVAPRPEDFEQQGSVKDSAGSVKDSAAERKRSSVTGRRTRRVRRVVRRSH